MKTETELSKQLKELREKRLKILKDIGHNFAVLRIHKGRLIMKRKCDI